MPVETASLAEASVANDALMRALLLMNGRNMLTKMQFKMESESTGRTGIGAGTFMDGSTVLEDSGSFCKSLAASITSKVPSLEMHGTKMSVLGANVTECGWALLALKGLEFLMNGPDVETEVTVAGE